MFGFLRRNPSPSSSSVQGMRDTLFGDMPLDAWPPSGAAAEQEPWRSFVKAREAIAAGQTAEAIAAWRCISEMPSLESRHYAQAWHFLRTYGVQPPADKAKLLLGVVVEVSMHAGVDLLAAYPEHTARYWNYSGKSIVWEHADQSLDPFIDALLRSGEQILRIIGPWEKPRPPVPPVGHMRVNLLAPSGLHLGEGPVDVLSADPLAKPAVEAATVLMQQLIALPQRR